MADNPFAKYADPKASDNPFAKYAAAEVAGQPAKPVRSFGGDVKAYGRGLHQAAYDIPQSLIEMGARGLDAAGATKGAYPMMHDIFSGDAPKGDKYYTGGRIAGNILETAPLAGLKVVQGASLLPRTANAAAQGGAAAALTSSGNEGNLGTNVGASSAVSGALPLLGAAGRVAAKGVPYVLGNITTGAGREAVNEAFRAGKAGGERAKAFVGNMRGTIPMGQVVEQAKAALGNMRTQRNYAYRSGMSDISKDASVLSFEPIEQAMAKTSGVKNFKGIDTSPKTAAVRAEIQGEIDKWKALDPKEYHTPEGFDALKQILGDIKDDLPFGSPQRTVAENAYNAVRQSIAKQAPAYDKVMKDYAEASDELAALQAELSLGPKGNPNTALKKLQSIMQNNVNTNWGKRAEYAGTLEDAGATKLIPSIAGQAMSSPTPRGLNRLLAGMGAGGSYFAGSLLDPMTLTALAATSPRLVGEGAHLAGQVAGGAANIAQKVPFQLPRLAPALSPAFGFGVPQLLPQ